MSDEYFAQRARRRSRRVWILGILIAGSLLVLLGLRSLLYNACTHSFDRSPASVARAYAEAILRGDQPAAQGCWQHEAYYDLEAGCSEICLSKLLGAQYEIRAVRAGEPSLTAEKRANLVVSVSVACTGGDSHTGEVLLDSVAGSRPWKHWFIVRSTFGGKVAEPWCK